MAWKRGCCCNLPLTASSFRLGEGRHTIFKKTLNFTRKKTQKFFLYWCCCSCSTSSQSRQLLTTKMCLLCVLLSTCETGMIAPPRCFATILLLHRGVQPTNGGWGLLLPVHPLQQAAARAAWRALLATCLLRAMNGPAAVVD